MSARCTLPLTLAVAFAVPMMALSAQSVSYSQSTFDPLQWSFSTVTLDGVGTGTEALSPSGGNPGDYWRHTFGIAQHSGTSRRRIANMNSTFLYDPSVRGALESLSFSFDVLGSSTSGFNVPFFGFFVPTLRQNGQFFFTSTSAISTAGWSNFTMSLSGASSWTDPNNSGSALRPDFSSSGGVIEFGYIYSVGANCLATTCGAASIDAGLDNFSVTATAAGPSTTVPEPSTYALMAAGLAGMLVMARRRRVA
jgi:PEP-CTERM motif